MEPAGWNIILYDKVLIIFIFNCTCIPKQAHIIAVITSFIMFVSLKGILDFLVVKKEIGNRLSIKAYRNDFNTDTTFLKITGI